MAAESWMLRELIEVLGWTLLHFVWQGIAAAVLFAALLLMLRRASAHSRYLAACGVFALMAFAPLVTGWWLSAQTRGLGTEISPDARRVGRVIETHQTLATDVVGLDDSTHPTDDAPPSIVEPPFSMPSQPLAAAGVSPTSESWIERSRQLIERNLGWIVGVWLLGVTLLSLRLLVGWWSVQRLRRRASRPASESWQALLRRLSERLRVIRPVKLVESALVEVPTVIGWLSPVILLPASAISGLTPEQLEALLAHELAHVRRHDYFINLLQTVVETLLFYHPAVWWVSHRIRLEREICCDDLAASVCGDRLSYAKALVAMEQLRAPSLELALSSRGGSLIARIHRLMGSPERERAANGNLATVLIAIVLLPLTGVAVHRRQTVSADDESRSRSAPSEADIAITNLDQLVARVREQEAQFENLDVSVRMTRTRQFRIAAGNADFGALADNNDAPKILVTVDSNYRAVTSQGRLWFQGEDIATHPDREPLRVKRQTVFDGERTLSVEMGNSVAVHYGRFEPSQCMPPHALPLFGIEVNFPLSVFLRGTEGLQSHPKVRRPPVERGTIYEFPKLEIEFVGEELLDGLDCVVVNVKRWQYTRDPPRYQDQLWLAKQRNFHVAQAATALLTKGVAKPWVISRVANWQELSPGVWLPKIVQVEPAATDANAAEQLRLSRRLVAWKAKLNPTLPADFFKHPDDIPADLPIFVIGPERQLVVSPHHPTPAAGSTPTTLESIIARLTEEEKKYSEIDVVATTSHRHLNHDNLIHGETPASSNTRERSVESGGRSFYEMEAVFHSGNGGWNSRLQQAFDGQWSRSSSKSAHQSDRAASHSFAAIDLSNANERNLNRPHTLFSYRPFLASLAKALQGGAFDAGDSRKTNAIYLGDEVIDSLLCHKLQCEPVRTRPTEQQSFYLIWLARDRNLIPIRYEWHDLGWDATLPTGQTYVEELREIRPGVWFPSRVTYLAFQKFGRKELSRPLIQWRRDLTVDQAQLDLRPDEKLFTTIEIPEGTTVSVRDEQSQYIGNFVTKQTGKLDITLEQLAELRQQTQERQEATERQK